VAPWSVAGLFSVIGIDYNCKHNVAVINV